MVGSPYQTSACLAKDLKFIETFQPHMCGIGPFIPHHDTQFRGGEPAGRVTRPVICSPPPPHAPPNLLLPATTALGTLDPIGREKGHPGRTATVMPNLSPVAVRKKYALYDNKISWRRIRPVPWLPGSADGHHSLSFGHRPGDMRTA